MNTDNSARSHKQTSGVITLAVFLTVLIFSNFLLAPYTWAPLIDDIDIELVTKESDALFSKCADQGYVDKFSTVFLQVDPTASPYIYGLYARGRDWIEFHIFCSEVIHIPMWNDWWSTNAGLYVIKVDTEIPPALEQSMVNVGGRVFRNNNPGNSSLEWYWWSNYSVLQRISIVLTAAVDLK